MSSVNQKECVVCGSQFSKRYGSSANQWEKRKFCSFSCANVLKKDKDITDVIEKNTLKKDCWIWVGPKDSYGYGVVNHRKTRRKAHRVSYKLYVGEIPTGMNVCHKCDNPSCINPEHLFLGTQKDNLKDMSSKGRMNKISFLNLRPGAKGFYGAGPISVGGMV